MTIRRQTRQQYQAKVAAAQAALEATALLRPPEGWIATVRKALGMSGAQLARRRGRTRARISQAERAEVKGGVTLKSMHEMAAAMGCKFVYAIVPEGTLEEIIEAQARRKAKAIVDTASAHMALEAQSLPDARHRAEIDAQTADLVQRQPADLWDDP